MRSLSKLDLRLGKQLIRFRVVKIVCTGRIKISFFINSLEMLPRYCNINFVSQYFSVVLRLPQRCILFFVLYSQLVNCIFEKIPYPMSRLLILFPIFFYFLSMLQRTLPNGWCFRIGEELFLVLCFFMLKGCTATIFQSYSII